VKILDLIREREGEQFTLHAAHLNGQMVKVLKTIGFDRTYVSASGQYLYDAHGGKTLDLLSGFGVFALGRNHPAVIECLQDVLSADLPHLVQLDVSLLAGLLAEKLVEKTPPGLDRIFFCNSGTESVEAAMKFARQATGRPKFVYCDQGYHGLTLGALSLNGDDHFRDGFGPLLPHCVEIPYDDLDALESVLADGDVAAFIVEPILGHGVRIPSDDYLPGAQALCRKHGALFVLDEVQTGIGRTGKFFAAEHWDLEPDMLTMAKALSGGFVPVGAVACRREVFDATFDRLDRAVVHGSTFSKNNLAMAAGLATIDVIEQSGLLEHTTRIGDAIVRDLEPLVDEFEFLKNVRGKGLMLALEFGQPDSLGLKAAWKLLEKANEGLFCQLVTVPLFTKHNILSQVAGHGMHVVKFLPPLVIDDTDRQWMVEAVRDVVAETHRLRGGIWELGKTLATQALKMKAGDS
jgi:ornithine--oxo-acid transaminase